jgi:uncharacterized protein YciW
MPVIEQEQLELIVSEASASGQLRPEQASVLRQFFADVNNQARTLYDSGLTVTSQMYEREQIAQFWKNQRELFEAQLSVATQIKRRFENSRSLKESSESVLTELDLDSLIATLEDLVSACSEHYEFHA